MLTQFIRFQWQQIVDKLKTIHAVHQFVPYAKSRLATWVESPKISAHSHIWDKLILREFNTEFNINLVIIQMFRRAIIF